eukprot:8858392-Pyramimonas_sp.AAC.1
MGRSWGPWSCLGASDLEKGDNVINVDKHNENQLVLSLGPSWGFLGGPLGALLGLVGASWAVSEASWAILAASVASQVRVGCHPGRLGRLGERLGRVWAPIEPRKQGVVHGLGVRARKAGGP